MNVKDFEYLVELKKAGSISKAAQALYISQPALSKFLKKLEEEAGTPLFQHAGRHLVPTFAGEQCIETASEILFLHNRMLQTLADIAQLKCGQIHLGLPMSRSSYIIARILPLFYREYPGICIHISEDSSQILLKKLRAGELDLAFVNVGEMDSDLEYRIVSREELVLAAPTGFLLQEKAFPVEGYRYPCLAPGDWIGCPFLMLSQDQASRKYADRYFAVHKLTPRTQLKIRNLGKVLYSVQQGLGVTICPSMPIVSDGDSKICYFSLPSDSGPVTRHTAIVYRKDAYLSVAEKMLIWMIQNCYGMESGA